ncbi:MAG: hypothetical protein QHC40_07540 [Sphingobium sp.]|nr:hypothetical protein [Sphingobium sp.]
MSKELDVNYLLHRQQISLLRAQSARSSEGRVAYEEMARGYSDRITAYARQNRITPRSH